MNEGALTLGKVSRVQCGRQGSADVLRELSEESTDFLQRPGRLFAELGRRDLLGRCEESRDLEGLLGSAHLLAVVKNIGREL